MVESLFANLILCLYALPPQFPAARRPWAGSNLKGATCSTPAALLPRFRRLQRGACALLGSLFCGPPHILWDSGLKSSKELRCSGTSPKAFPAPPNKPRCPCKGETLPKYSPPLVKLAQESPLATARIPLEPMRSSTQRG